MLFRFTLIHANLGTLVINEPDGWKECKLKLERDKNFKSLVEYFDGSFIFYGNNGVVDGGIDFIKKVEDIYGFDALIRITIELSVDGYTYNDLFKGQLNLAGAVEMPDNKIQIPIIRDDFWSKFINRLDTPVDVQSALSLDGGIVNNFDSVNLRMTSQKIQKKYISYINKAVVISEDEWVNGQYLQVGYDENELDEIDETFDIPTGINPDIPVYTLIANQGGDHEFNFRIEVSKLYYNVTGSGGTISDCVSTRTIDSTETLIQFYVKKNDEPPILLTVTNAPLILINRSSWYTYNDTLSLNKGDVVRFYGLTIDDLNYGDVSNFVIWGRDNSSVTVDRCTVIFDPGGLLCGCFQSPGLLNLGLAPSQQINATFFEIIAQTISPETNSFGFFIHDLGGQICDRITNQNESFYSEVLGSSETIYKQYYSDGCHWPYIAAKGLQIRQYSLIEKPFFQSFNQWWKGVNPILCLGLGYEVLEGRQVIRIERMEDFYDSSSVSITINNVRQITRKYDQSVIFKTVKVGYNQWQSENISGIDDPQTKHTYATRFSKTGEDLTIESDFIAASLAIETTRRTTRIKSADYKFDNNTFIIAVNPFSGGSSDILTSPDVTDYYPELDENFASITNLLNSETRYNSRITPARNLIRWIRFISGSLQSYLTSKFKFVSGEGNYDMTSDMDASDGCDEYKLNLSEKQDINVYNDPLHLALLYEVVIPLEWEDYVLIRDNRKKAIQVSQTNVGHVKFFIETLEYDLVKSQATISAWPVSYMDIQTLESNSFMVACDPIFVTSCEDAYLTEDGFECITEDGNCLILN